MWGRIVVTYVLLVGVIGGTAYAVFPWFTLTAVGMLALFSAIATAIALFMLKITGRLQTGGGDGPNQHTKRSKGARDR